MPDIQIDKLALKLVTDGKNTDKAAAERLAQSVAAGISRMSLAANLPERVEQIRVRVDAPAGATISALTERVLAELMRELQRS